MCNECIKKYCIRIGWYDFPIYIFVCDSGRTWAAENFDAKSEKKM
jgi:hypothetical protein